MVLWDRSAVESLGFEVQGKWSDLEETVEFQIDSRQVKPGNLFVALKGENLDGNRFVEAAFKQGAVGALVSLEFKNQGLVLLKNYPDRFLILAPDSLRALGEWAAFHRRKFKDLVVIGVTGSNGKTTTKEMLAQLLQDLGPLYCTPGNFNSEIGLPLSVLQLRNHHRVAVLEMGMNHKGEMGWITSVALPQMALITNIGSAHIGILGSREAIAKEKKAIFSHFHKNSVGVIPRESDFFDFLGRDIVGKVLDFGNDDAQGVKDLGVEGTEFIWRGQKFHLPIPGKHNFSNALGALTVAEALGVKVESMAQKLGQVHSLMGRFQIVKGAYTLVKDYYNANLDSMRALLDWVRELEWPGRVVGVLGSMRELGAKTDEFHRQLFQDSLSVNWGELYFFGEEARVCLDEAVRLGRPDFQVKWTVNIDELCTWVLDSLRPGDLVVIKGSRGVALERLAEKLEVQSQKEALTAHVL